MTSTDLAVIEKGAYVALARPFAEIQEILDDTLAGADVTEFDLPRVKLPSGGGTIWEVPGAGGSEGVKELTGVLVGFKRTRGYWENPDPSGEPPQCKSDDAITGVGNPGGDCKTCPYSQFGSSPKGGNAQACKEKEIWFLLRPDSFLPLAVALPATSLKGARKYRINLVNTKGEGGLPLRYSEVVTSLTLVGDKAPTGEPYSIAVPRLVGRLGPEETKTARAYAEALRPQFEAAAAAMTDEAPSAGAPVNADIAA